MTTAGGRWIPKAWRAVIILFAALSLLRPVAISAQPQIGPRVLWSVVPDDGFCVASTNYDGDAAVHVVLNWKTDQISLFLFDPSWIRLAKPDGARVDLALKLQGNGKHNRWSSENAVINHVEDVGVSLIVARWNKEHIANFLSSWSSTSGFSVDADGLKLRSFPLAGSKDAMSRLSQCAADGLKRESSGVLVD
ncbi:MULTISPECIES: hypothetical protein [unclassified Sphingopyxis]|uniref:hypothetical protein n=1 Tax=unclassified Sphingopyxis TaxID=2614943 RepID=UPI0012E37F22|nr:MULTISPECIES: hypothetical protein [unclassified Sphingopyxis]